MNSLPKGVGYDVASIEAEDGSKEAPENKFTPVMKLTTESGEPKNG
jgi:hypothetical protein